MNSVASTEPLTRFGRMLADPTRARILLKLCESPAYPSDLAIELNISKQSVSNHLACLRGCGLVTAKVDGRRSLYELADANLIHALFDLKSMVLNIDPAACEETGDKDCC